MKKKIEREEKKDNEVVENKKHKALDVIVDVFTVLMVVFSVFLMVLSLTSKAHYGIPTVGNNSYLRVKSESMQGTINKNDLIVVKHVDFTYDKTDNRLEPSIEFKENETIISFWYDVDNDGVNDIVTHLLKDVSTDGTTYYCQGTYHKDGETLATQEVLYSAVIGVYTGHKVPLLGGLYGFLMDTKYCWGFLVCVLLPVFIIFLIKLYKLIVAVMDAKSESMKEALASQSVMSDEEREQEKARMRAEILKELAEEEEKKNKEKNNN